MTGRRFSAHSEDPGYEPYCAVRLAGKVVHVFLDGEPVKHAETADEAEGFVVLPKFDWDGCLAVEGGSIVRETRRGVVRCVLCDRGAPAPTAPPADAPPARSAQSDALARAIAADKPLDPYARR